MPSTAGQEGPSDRRRHRHRRRHLARHRQEGQLGASSPPANPASAASPASPTDALQDHASPAPSISCRSSRFCSPALSERLGDLAAEEAIDAGRHRPQGRFSGAAVPRRRAGRDRMDAARGARARQRRATTPSPTTTCCARSPAASGDFYERFLFGSVAEHARRPFGTKGSPISLSTACASGATAIQLGVEAIRRGETDAALCIGTDGSVNAGIADPLLAAVGAVDAERPAARRRQAVLQEPRRLRDGRRRRRAGAGKPRARQGARRENPRRHRGLRRDGGRLPPHPLEPGRQADHRLHPQRPRRRRPHARRHRLHQCARHRHAGERQDGIPRRRGRVRRARQDDPDLVEQVDDRPYAVGGRRGRGGVHAADARASAAAADHQLRRCPTRRSRSTSCPMWRATPRCGTRCRTRSASAARTSRLVHRRAEPADVEPRRASPF